MISFGDCIVQHATQNMHIFSEWHKFRTGPAYERIKNLSTQVQFFMSVVCLLVCDYIHGAVHVCMYSVT